MFQALEKKWALDNQSLKLTGDAAPRSCAVV